MARSQPLALPSNQPDLQVLAALGAIHRVLLLLVTVFAAITLAAWLIPPLGHVLPLYWRLMKANTAFLVLLCALSLRLSEPKQSNSAVRLSRLLAGVAILISMFFVCERLRGVSLPVDTFLAADAASPNPGIVSIQNCGTVLLMAFVLRNLRVRKRFLAHIVDAATLCIILLMLTFTSRYFFGVSQVFGITQQDPMSPQTFVVLTILAWLIVNRRAEYGAFSVLIGGQIGGKTTRFAAPYALVLPYIFAFARLFAIRFMGISDASATAATTTALSVLAFCLVLARGSRINDLENAIRELSLRDDLTQLYNRRGFYVLAEQALRLAQRAGEPFFVLFVDVDDLKKTNDAHGHEVGSQLLCQTAALLERTFRETDVIGRIGGDEFVVAGRLEQSRYADPLQRIEDALLRENARPGRQFPISFSVGYTTADATGGETLDLLLQKADATMYQAKRARKCPRADAPVAVLA
jgi:diguanylate cyclase (GGDEF)-like protein